MIRTLTMSRTGASGSGCHHSNVVPNKMKVLLALLILIAAPLTVGSPIPDFPFLFVGGHASEDVPTARARITFNIENENEKSEIGEAELQKANIAMMTLLRESGIPEKDIDASDVRKRRVSKDPFDEEKKQILVETRKVEENSNEDAITTTTNSEVEKK